MFLYSLLEASEQTTNLVKWISIYAILLLLILLACVGRFGKKHHFDTKRIAFAGVCVATSFVLALIKFKPVQYGGSVTLASFVPVLLYTYVYGVKDGLMVGLILGLLNFVESPYILTPGTFVLDYLLAFTSIGAMGFFGKFARKEKGVAPLVLGCVCVYFLRFFFHLLSGMIFFLNDAVWVSFPDWAMGNAFIYSFIYQCVYIPLDMAIALFTIIALAKSGVLDRLIKILSKNRGK